MNNSSRLASFDSFASNRDGYALSRRIHAMARHYASGCVAQIDPNWHSVEIDFVDPRGPHDVLVGRAQTDEDGCKVAFDYRPKRAVLVGPKVGHLLITGRVFEMVPEELLALMRVCDVFRPSGHVLRNQKHEIELIDGKTIIEFENCTRGVVRNVRPAEGDAFDVEGIDSIKLDQRDQVHFTRAKLMEGFKVDGLLGQPVCVDYFPLLAPDDTPIEDVKALLEHRRREREAWEADAPRREAEEAARRAEEEKRKAEAYAALSPEEKAKVDARKARFAAQAGIIRRLLPHLPRP